MSARGKMRSLCVSPHRNPYCISQGIYRGLAKHTEHVMAIRHQLWEEYFTLIKQNESKKDQEVSVQTPIQRETEKRTLKCMTGSNLVRVLC